MTKEVLKAKKEEILKGILDSKTATLLTLSELVKIMVIEEERDFVTSKENAKTILKISNECNDKCTEFASLFLCSILEAYSEDGVISQEDAKELRVLLAEQEEVTKEEVRLHSEILSKIETTKKFTEFSKARIEEYKKLEK